MGYRRRREHAARHAYGRAAAPDTGAGLSRGGGDMRPQLAGRGRAAGALAHYGKRTSKGAGAGNGLRPVRGGGLPARGTAGGIREA